MRESVGEEGRMHTVEEETKGGLDRPGREGLPTRKAAAALTRQLGGLQV